LSCASGEIRGNKSLENVFISGMERGEEEAVDRLRRQNFFLITHFKIVLGLGNPIF
jgi:hypothetical protein